MTAAEFVLLALAVYRTTRFLVTDSLTEMPRLRLAAAMPTGSKVTELAECPFCVSFWVSLAWLLIWHGWGGVGEALLLLWGLAGAAALLAGLDRALSG